MKTRNLLLAFAGLGLFACTNEDVKNGIEGDARVTVKINEAVSRALGNPSTGTNGQTFAVDIQSATITLVASAGGVNDMDIKGSLVGDGSRSIVFDEVRNPQSLVLKINGCQGSEGLLLKNVYNTELAEPLYAATASFNTTDGENYTATLTPQHRLARLQFSGIDFDTDNTTYTSLKLDGIYLNGAVKTEGGNDKAEANDKADWESLKTTLGADAPLWDDINAVVVGTGQVEGSWPKADAEGKAQCYAYNIFPVSGEANLPKLTVCFSDAEQPSVSIGDLRYARVKKYKVSGTHEGIDGIDSNGYITDFKAGYIYNITDLMIEDKDLGPTPGGGDDITLTATVTVSPWTLVNGTVEWN